MGTVNVARWACDCRSWRDYLSRSKCGFIRFSFSCRPIDYCPRHGNDSWYSNLPSYEYRRAHSRGYSWSDRRKEGFRSQKGICAWNCNETTTRVRYRSCDDVKIIIGNKRVFRKTKELVGAFYPEAHERP